MIAPRSSMRAAHRWAVAAATALVGVLATSIAAPAGTAHADACYTWERTLRLGMSGDDVRQLQIRIAGYPGLGSQLTIDGEFDTATYGAVRRFKNSNGLPATGVAGPRVAAALEALQDDDCTPTHYSYDDMDVGCGEHGFGGGAVSASEARRNALRIMWKLEALRHALGDRPIGITSGFRSYECNAGVGVPDSRHLYGDAADLVSERVGLCAIAREARRRGFDGIYGPGFPNHDDHVHVSGANESWSAPDCGIGSSPSGASDSTSSPSDR